MNKQIKKLPLVEKLLTVWVALAIIVGLCCDKYLPGLGDIIKKLIPLGLFMMVYPAMVKIRLEEVPEAMKNWKPLLLVIGINYLIAPFLMWGLGWVFLRNSPEMWIGLTLLGVAPCIGMVLVWTDLAKGNNLLSIVLRTWDTLIQIALVPLFLFLLITPILGKNFSGSALNMHMVMEIVVYFLAVPLILGLVSRKLIIKRKGEEWFEKRFLPPLGKFQLMALLFTIIVIFSQKGTVIIDNPQLIWSVGMPIIIFHFIVFLGTFYLAKFIGINYADGVAAGFNATGRNFELAITLGITVFAYMPAVGVATVIGPLVEIPMMLGIVWLVKRVSGRAAYQIPATERAN
jgi:ACR3 family arsenite transporter